MNSLISHSRKISLYITLFRLRLNNTHLLVGSVKTNDYLNKSILKKSVNQLERAWYFTKYI